MYQGSPRNGFTLIEIVLVVAVITLIGTSATYLSHQVMVRNDILTARDAIISSVYTARELSLLNSADGQWGIRVEDESVIIFQGNSYNSRDIDEDIITAISNSISVSGDQEYVFNQLTGKTNSSGSIVLTAGNIASTTVSINSYGVPSIQ